MTPVFLLHDTQHQHAWIVLQPDSKERSAVVQDGLLNFLEVPLFPGLVSPWLEAVELDHNMPVVHSGNGSLVDPLGTPRYVVLRTNSSRFIGTAT